MKQQSRIIVWALCTSLLHLGVVAYDYYNNFLLSAPRGYDTLKAALLSFPQMIPAYADVLSGNRSGVTWPGIVGMAVTLVLLVFPIHLGVHALVRVFRRMITNAY